MPKYANSVTIFQIIHTNMGNIVHSVAGRYGSQMQTGHADFYRMYYAIICEIMFSNLIKNAFNLFNIYIANGGEVQPGCNFLGDRCKSIY